MAEHVRLTDGRVLCVDDVGDPDGTPVVYLHGTPSSRLSRHPDDSIAAAAGIRLLAVDRPGIGGSSTDPQTTAASFADDLAVLLDRVDIERCRVIAWSAGALWALAMAARLGDRIQRVTVAAGLVPVDAFADAEVRNAAGEQRREFLNAVADLGPAEAAAAMAPFLVPYPCDADVAREHLAAVEAEWPNMPAELQDRMVESLVEALRNGLDGVIADLKVAASPLGVDLGSITTPLDLIYGDRDTTCPPAFGEWLTRELPDARLTIVHGADHGVAVDRWRDLLAAPDTSC